MFEKALQESIKSHQGSSIFQHHSLYITWAYGASQHVWNLFYSTCGCRQPSTLKRTRWTKAFTGTEALRQNYTKWQGAPQTARICARFIGWLNLDRRHNLAWKFTFLVLFFGVSSFACAFCFYYSEFMIEEIVLMLASHTTLLSARFGSV